MFNLTASTLPLWGGGETKERTDLGAVQTCVAISKDGSHSEILAKGLQEEFLVGIVVDKCKQCAHFAEAPFNTDSGLCHHGIEVTFVLCVCISEWCEKPGPQCITAITVQGQL